MTYPVYIGDRAAGTMTVTAAGQDTVFELRCPDPEPGLWRAWVQGEEGRLDLGILEGGRLRRRWRMKRGDFEEVLRLAGMTIPANRLARRRGTWALPYRYSIDRRFVGADVLGGPLYGDTDFSLWCHCEPAAGWRGNPFPRLLRRRHFQGGQSRPPLRLGSPFGGAVGAAD